MSLIINLMRRWTGFVSRQTTRSTVMTTVLGHRATIHSRSELNLLN